MKYGGYKKYKESGIHEIGLIPNDWSVRRLKFMARVQNGKDYKDVVSDDGYPVIGSGGEFAKASSYLYSGESVLLGRKGTIDKPLYINGSFWTVDTMFYTEVASDVSAKYFYYCALTINFLKYATSTALPSMTQQDLGAIPFAVPIYSEQQSIARFLDFKTAQIDALIAKKQALLEKLAEKRTALISHAVTKGLDPSMPMKDSGVKWLGEIPAHWVAKRLKFIISEPLKYGANEAAELTDPELPRYIRITDVNEDGSLREETFRSLPQDVADNYLLSDGDILLARSGATVGKSFIYKRSWGVAAYAGYLIRARMAETMDPDFVYLFLQSSCYWQWLKSIFIQATIQNVSAEKYANLIIPVPPINEQLKVVSRLLVQLKKIDAQREQVSLVIDRLIEYRSAAITNAVTGKIDVRDFKIPQHAESVAE